MILFCSATQISLLFNLFFFLSKCKNSIGSSGLHSVNWFRVQFDHLLLFLNQWLDSHLMTVVDAATHDSPLWLMSLAYWRIITVTGTCQQWVISTEQWLVGCGYAHRTKRKDEQLSSGYDPCWQPIWIIQIETTSFASLEGLGLDLVRSLLNFLCLWKCSTYICCLRAGLGVITTASVNLTFKFHYGLGVPCV